MKFNTDLTTHLSKARRGVNDEADERDETKADKDFPQLRHQ
jgi:hypothetical protein